MAAKVVLTPVWMLALSTGVEIAAVSATATRPSLSAFATVSTLSTVSSSAQVENGVIIIPMAKIMAKNLVIWFISKQLAHRHNFSKKKAPGPKTKSFMSRVTLDIGWGRDYST